MRTVEPSAGVNDSVVPVSVFVSLSMSNGNQVALVRPRHHVNMSKMKRLFVLILLAGLSLQAGAEPPQFTIQVGVDLVNVPFTVTDRHGRLQAGLTAADFVIEEDGKKQDILHFASENDLALTL